MAEIAEKQPEPWLRGTHTELPAVIRAVTHALELAEEDIGHWCEPLPEEDLYKRISGLPSIAFQLQHVARSLDRLLSYAEGKSLEPVQLQVLRTEADPEQGKAEVFAELSDAFTNAYDRILALQGLDLEAGRSVGRKKLPTTLGGLLVHIADHTQRHVGQLITTAKVLSAAR